MRQTKQKASKYPLLKALTAPFYERPDWAPIDETTHHLYCGGVFLLTIRNKIAKGKISIEAVKWDNDLDNLLETDKKLNEVSRHDWACGQVIIDHMESYFTHGKLFYYSRKGNKTTVETMLVPTEARMNNEEVFLIVNLHTIKGKSVLSAGCLTYTKREDPMLEAKIGSIASDVVAETLGAKRIDDPEFDEQWKNKVVLSSLKGIVLYRIWKQLFQESITTEAIPASSKKADLGFKVKGGEMANAKVTILLDHIEDRRTLIGQFIRDSHIRLQRHGKGNRLVKPVLIKSTTVKAHTRK